MKKAKFTSLKKKRNVSAGAQETGKPKRIESGKIKHSEDNNPRETEKPKRIDSGTKEQNFKTNVTEMKSRAKKRKLRLTATRPSERSRFSKRPPKRLPRLYHEERLIRLNKNKTTRKKKRRKRKGGKGTCAKKTAMKMKMMDRVENTMKMWQELNKNRGTTLLVTTKSTGAKLVGKSSNLTKQDNDSEGVGKKERKTIVETQSVKLKEATHVVSEDEPNFWKKTLEAERQKIRKKRARKTEERKKRREEQKVKKQTRIDEERKREEEKSRKEEEGRKEREEEERKKRAEGEKKREKKKEKERKELEKEKMEREGGIKPTKEKERRKEKIPYEGKKFNCPRCRFLLKPKICRRKHRCGICKTVILLCGSCKRPCLEENSCECGMEEKKAEEEEKNKKKREEEGKRKKVESGKKREEEGKRKKVESGKKREEEEKRREDDRKQKEEEERGKREEERKKKKEKVLVKTKDEHERWWTEETRKHEIWWKERRKKELEKRREERAHNNSKKEEDREQGEKREKFVKKSMISPVVQQTNLQAISEERGSRECKSNEIKEQRRKEKEMKKEKERKRKGEREGEREREKQNDEEKERGRKAIHQREFGGLLAKKSGKDKKTAMKSQPKMEMILGALYLERMGRRKKNRKNDHCCSDKPKKEEEKSDESIHVKSSASFCFTLRGSPSSKKLKPLTIKENAKKKKEDKAAVQDSSIHSSHDKFMCAKQMNTDDERAGESLEEEWEGEMIHEGDEEELEGEVVELNPPTHEKVDVRPVRRISGSSSSHKRLFCSSVPHPDETVSFLKNRKPKKLPAMDVKKKKKKMKKKKEKEKQDCPLCCMVVDKEIRLKNCGHVVHESCVKKQVEANLFQEKIRCPAPAGQDKCDQYLSDEEISSVLDKKHLHMRNEYFTTQYMDRSSNNVKKCVNRSCPCLISMTEDMGRYECRQCEESLCARCEVKWHVGKTCQQYQEESKFWKGEAEVTEWLRNNSGNRCPECFRPTEKSYACDHIKCGWDRAGQTNWGLGCDTLFCIICGGVLHMHNNVIIQHRCPGRHINERKNIVKRNVVKRKKKKKGVSNVLGFPVNIEEQERLLRQATERRERRDVLSIHGTVYDRLRAVAARRLAPKFRRRRQQRNNNEEVQRRRRVEERRRRTRQREEVEQRREKRRQDERRRREEDEERIKRERERAERARIEEEERIRRAIRQRERVERARIEEEENRKKRMKRSYFSERRENYEKIRRAIRQRERVERARIEEEENRKKRMKRSYFSERRENYEKVRRAIRQRERVERARIEEEENRKKRMRSNFPERNYEKIRPKSFPKYPILSKKRSCSNNRGKTGASYFRFGKKRPACPRQPAVRPRSPLYPYGSSVRQITNNQTHRNSDYSCYRRNNNYSTPVMTQPPCYSTQMNCNNMSYGNTTTVNNQFGTTSTVQNQYGGMMMSNGPFGSCMMANTQFGFCMMANTPFGSGMVMRNQFGTNIVVSNGG